MKRTFLIALCGMLCITIIGCSSKPKYNTGDKQLDKDLEEIYDSIVEDYYDEENNIDDEEDFFSEVDFSIENVHMTDDETISFFIEHDMEERISWNDYKSNYFTNVSTDYYGEIKELMGEHEGRMNGVDIDEVLDDALLMQFDAPTEFPLEEYKYLVEIGDRETKEVLFSREIKPYEVKSQGNELKWEYILKKLKSYKNSTNDVSISIENATSTILDERWGSYEIKIETKVKNNSDTLLRIENLSVFSPTLCEIRLVPDIKAVKPGEEATIIFSEEEYDVGLNMFYEENSNSEYIMSLKYCKEDIGMRLNFVESNKFKEAMNDYVNNR